MDEGTRDSQDREAGASAFESASREKSPGIVREFVDFLRHNKKWWIAPIVAMLLLIGLFVVLSGTAAAPFIYTLF